MNGLEVLKGEALEAQRSRYPRVPDFALTVPKYSDKTGNGLTKCILDWLHLHGCYAVRVNTQGQYRVKLGRWTKSTTARGTADIHAIIGGRAASIEVKAGRDRMSEAQEKTREQVEESGGIYLIIRSFDEFYTWWQMK